MEGKLCEGKWTWIILWITRCGKKHREKMGRKIE